MAGVCRQGYFVSCEGASEEITRPHRGREMSRISAIDAGFEPSEYGKSVGDVLCSGPSHVDDITWIPARSTRMAFSSAAWRITHALIVVNQDSYTVIWSLHGFNGCNGSSDRASNFRNHDATPSDFALARASA